MKTKLNKLFVLIVLVAALTLQACTVQTCQKVFGYNPYPNHPNLVCTTIYTDGTKPVYTIMLPGIATAK